MEGVFCIIVFKLHCQALDLYIIVIYIDKAVMFYSIFFVEETVFSVSLTTKPHPAILYVPNYNYLGLSCEWMLIKTIYTTAKGAKKKK